MVPKGICNNEKPIFVVLVDGKELPSTFRVVSLEVCREVNRIPFARIVLEDGCHTEGTFAASESAELTPGNTLEIQAGYDDRRGTIFVGVLLRQQIRISTTGSELVVEARDKTFEMNLVARSRLFLASKDSENAVAVCQEYGIKPNCCATDVQHSHMVQYETTDWAFLLMRMLANGHLVFITDGELNTGPPESSGIALVDLVFGQNIVELDCAFDARDSLASVSTRSWGFSSLAVDSVQASEPNLTDVGDLDPLALSKAAGGSNQIINNQGQFEPAELQAWADGVLLKSRMAMVRGKVRCKGFVEAQPGQFFSLAGLGDHFSGAVFVTGINHKISEGDWTVEMQFGIDPKWFDAGQQRVMTSVTASGAPVPMLNGLFAATVLQLADDPDGQDRIKVNVPLVFDQETEGVWARVACLDAGENRGTFFRPEIGDEVLLGFMGDDPRHPVVLGMFNSSAKPAPVTPADDNNHLKGIYTRSGMTFTFDDENKVIEITTPQGNVLLMSEDSENVQLQDQNGNKFTLDSSGMALNSCKDINLTAAGDINLAANSSLNLKATTDLTAEGLNVDLEAQAQITVKGNAGAELQSSGLTVVKGTMVNIN